MPYNDDIFNEKNEVKRKQVKFGKIGDAFKGTLLGVKTVEVDDMRLGRKVPKKIYEFRAHGGSLHDIVDRVPSTEETTVNPGELYVIWSRGKMFDDDMASVKPGFIVAFRYTGDTVPTDKKKLPGKIVKIFKGGRDPEYMGEDAESLAKDFGGTVVQEPSY